MNGRTSQVSIVGTGFIAQGVFRAIGRNGELRVSRILTRRPLHEVRDLPAELLTDSLDDLVSACDVVLECSGDVIHATRAVQSALKAGLPVVTMCCEFHVTSGSLFCDQGLLTEAEGDQPGCLAALHEEVVGMGFQPLVYGNIKGFLNHEPTEEEMRYWSQRYGISLNQVTSFTDGTKIQIEQALVANGLGAELLQTGMVGLRDVSLETAGDELGQRAREKKAAVIEYVLNAKLPGGVFIVADHPTEPPEVLRYLKMGEGPYYTILRPYHLCHLEVPKTIQRVLREQGPLLNNSSLPRVNVFAIAKKDLVAGSEIPIGIGGFHVRGEAMYIEDEPEAVPIGLLCKTRVVRNIRKGETIHWDQVEVPDSLAMQAWQEIRRRVLANSESPHQSPVSTMGKIA
jgi:predicted homoserine dehydrogenase-like protein